MVGPLAALAARIFGALALGKASYDDDLMPLSTTRPNSGQQMTMGSVCCPSEGWRGALGVGKSRAVAVDRQWGCRNNSDASIVQNSALLQIWISPQKPGLGESTENRLADRALM
jgi:hypothetical protein